MRRWLSRLRAIASAYLALATVYRAGLYLWALTGVLPLILMGVWAEASQRGHLQLSSTEFVQYFLSVFLVHQLTLVWVIWEFEAHVVRGTLSPLLLQPMNPVWRFVVAHLTERVARVPFAVGIVGLGFVLYPEALWVPSVAEAAVAGIAIAAAFVVRFVLQYAISMLCFWSERASAVEGFWALLSLFLSGKIAPLELYPEAVRRIAEWTPFPYIIYVPAQLLLGRPVDLVQAATVLGIWGALGWAVQLLLWRRGLRRYSAMGA